MGQLKWSFDFQKGFYAVLGDDEEIIRALAAWIADFSEALE